MFLLKKLAFVLCILFISIDLTRAAMVQKAIPFRNYELLQIKTVVSNSKQCEAIHRTLTDFSRNSIHVNFVSSNTEGNLTVKENSGTLMNHTYTLVEQKISDHTVDRTGIGHFDINQKTIAYVIRVGADTEQANFKYLYPMILSADNAHCFYTAILRPMPDTISSFKKNIQNGLVAKGTDLPVR